MAEQKRERRWLDLTPEEWRRLESLAEKTSSRPRRGKNAYQCDWRAMLRSIASGDVLVSEATPNPHIKRIDEALAKLQTPEEVLVLGRREGNNGTSEQSGQHQKEPPRTYRQLSILEAA